MKVLLPLLLAVIPQATSPLPDPDPIPTEVPERLLFSSSGQETIPGVGSTTLSLDAFSSSHPDSGRLEYTLGEGPTITEGTWVRQVGPNGSSFIILIIPGAIGRGRVVAAPQGQLFDGRWRYILGDGTIEMRTYSGDFVSHEN